MYWGKKIIEWTEKPEQAFDICLKLNNKYKIGRWKEVLIE